MGIKKNAMLKWVVVLIAAIMLCGCAGETAVETINSVTTKIHTQTTFIETPQTTAGTQSSAATQTQKFVYDGVLRVHFIDVGQGDSAFIELPGGKNILIDAGGSGAADRIAAYIKKLGYTGIDILIATHPHNDHIGGISAVMERFEIGKFYLSPATHTSATFEKMLDTVAALGTITKTVREGDVIYEDGFVKAEVLSPAFDYADLNNSSVVMLVTFGETRFLFTGDIEAEAESNLRDVPQCNVLKVAHHGSKTSSTAAFLDMVLPEIAVISCGEDNAYGHPSEEVLMRLAERGVEILRTENGTVVISSDGNSVTCE